jgi:hypothetical protein
MAAKIDQLELKCFEQNKTIKSFECEINRLEDFNKELKLDFDRKVEFFNLKNIIGKWTMKLT